MKKNRLFVGLISLVSLLSLVGCSNGKAKKEAHKIELVHQFVNAMKVDQSSYLAKGYKMSFEQDFEVSYIANTEFSTMEYSLKNISSGEASRFFEPAVSGRAVSGRYNDGRGYFSGQQTGNVNFHRKITDKETNAVENRKSNYVFNHNFGIKYDETALSVSGLSTLNNKLSNSSNENKEFKGRIAKNTLGRYSDAYLDSLIDNILYLDGWDEAFAVVGQRQEYYQNTAFSSDESISNLIKELSFEVAETETTIEIGFKINSGKVIKDIYNKDISNAGIISGKININKATERIESYEYDLKDYFSTLLSYGSTAKEQYSYKVNSFVVRGLNLNTTFDQLNITGPLNDFDENTATLFSTSFNDVIVPHIDNVVVID